MQFEKGQIWKSKKPMRWTEIRVMACVENYVVYTYKEGHPFVQTEADFEELLKACQYYVS